MTKRYGLESFKDNSVNNDLLLLKAGGKALVRLLQEPEDMAVITRHWAKGYGYIHCIGADCPLCSKASAEWGAPITKAKDTFLAPLIDRTDDKVRVFEGGRTIKNTLLQFYKLNGSITQSDFVIKRNEGKKGKDTYEMIPIVKLPVLLTQAEIDRIKEVDLEWLIKRGDRTEAEMLTIIDTIMANSDDN
ncbi:MAG: hypothetical protein WC529_01280 [Candidatus Margulisiibacteriota bacterium]